MRRLVLLSLLAVACRREAPADPPATVDAAPPVGEVVVPAPEVAVGDVLTTRSETVATGTVRLYKEGKWKGNGNVAITTVVESRREVLAVDGGRASRLRLEYPSYRSTMKVGGDERDLTPRLAGRTFIADLAGGLSVVAGDGAAVAPPELELLRRDIEGLSMWAPVQGRKLVLGETIEGPPPWNARFVVKDRGEKTAALGARVTMGDVVVDGEAALELESGRVTRFAGDGIMKIGGAGDARMRVVETYVHSR